jgi:predicted Zn-dependent peptidase
VTQSRPPSACYHRRLPGGEWSPHPTSGMETPAQPTAQQQRPLSILLVAGVMLLTLVSPLWSQQLAQVPVEEFRLPNGMRFLLVHRPQAPMVAAGWVTRAGSADDEPELTGLAHLMEHLLFKGSRTVGVRNFQEEQLLLDRQDRLFDELLQLREKARRAGTGSRKRDQLDQQIAASESELQDLRSRARSLAALGEYSLLYSEGGATQLNAHTLRDLTIFNVTLPTERLELWFWLESDHLLQAVFREFFKEVQVVREERRMRVDSTPTGLLDEKLDQRFWQSHPYASPPLGHPGDLDRLRREDAYRFLSTHYTPEKMTAALVGNFDPQVVKRLAHQYFGRLPAAPAGPDRPRPVEPRRGPGETLDATCDCPTQTQVLYPTVPFGHPDSTPLEVLAGVLNGRTGRLYRSLVLGREIAFAASAAQNSLHRAGYFSFTAEAKGQATTENLLVAWDSELERLTSQPVPEAELEKVKNRLTADAFRRLKDPVSLLQQLLVYDGLGDWRHLNQWPTEVLAVSPDEIRELARRYLQPAARTVAFYRRSEAAKP